MDNKKIIQMQEPLEVGGKTLTEIEVRRSTIGDEEDAMQTAVQMKRAISSSSSCLVQMEVMTCAIPQKQEAVASVYGLGGRLWT